MPLTVTATVDATTKTVSVEVDGGTPPYTLTASPVGSSPYAVRGEWTGTSPTLTKVDAEVRLNTDTQYSATDSASGSASSSVVNVAGTDALMSDALDYTQVLPVLVVRQPPNEYEARTRTWDVIGRQDPFVSSAPMRLRSGDLVIRVTPTERVAVLALLATGNPILLRSVHPLAVDDVYMGVQRVRDDLVLEDNPTGDRLLTLTYQAVSRDLGTYVPSADRTYTQLLADATTYTDTLVKFERYDDVRTGAFR